MYEEFYNLSGRPFQLTPDPRFYFDTRTHRKAMAYLKYGLNQREGFIIITGDIGAGKTTLVGHLFNELESSDFVFAKVVTTQINADDLMRLVAAAFGIKNADDMSKASLIQHIETFLRNQHRAGKRALLIVDEAQNLPISALEELRMLSNFQSGNTALLQSFLLGQPEFRDQLASSPALEQLRQRVIATHHLDPMVREELDGYVEHRLRLVGWKDDPSFTDDAYDRIYEYTAGVPRRLNTLMSRILLYGALEEIHEMNAKVVDDVIHDLEKDKTPTTGPKHSGTPLSTQAKAELNGGHLEPMKFGGMQADVMVSLQAIEQRLDKIEKYVGAHDRAIRKTVNFIADWMEKSEGTNG